MTRNMTMSAFMIRKNTFRYRKFFSTEDGKMPFTAEAVREELTGRVRELARTSPEESVKGRLRWLARHIGLPASRIAKYWYGLVPSPPAHEADQIRAYYTAAQELIRARQEYEKRRGELLQTHSRMAFLAPPALCDTAISNEAMAAVETAAARRNRR
jgi:hypothetical protein